jgi:hypothetical protein
MRCNTACLFAVVSLEQLYRSLQFQEKKNTADRWKDKQHVKVPLREDNGIVWGREQPKTTSDGVKAVKKKPQ